MNNPALTVGPPPVVDAVQYVLEPPDLWADAVPQAVRASAPRVVDLPGGGQGWSFDDGAWLRPLGLEVGAGRAPDVQPDRSFRFDELPAGATGASARLDDMEREGIGAAVVYPTFATELRSLRDPAVQVACVRAYNDFVAQWVADGDAARLVPHALMPLVGIDEAVAELDRVATVGFRAVVFAGWPAAGRDPTPEDDRFWARCQEAGITISLLRGGPAPDRTPSAPARHVGAGDERVRVSDIPQALLWTQRASTNNQNVAWLVLTGVFDRFPDLKVVLADAGAGWLPTCGELLDWNYRYAQFLAFARLRLRPSDYIRRNVFVTLRDEPYSIQVRGDIGVGSMMWSTGYPDTTSTWPDSAPRRAELFAGVPEREQELMIGRTAAELYGLRLAVPASSPA